MEEYIFGRIEKNEMLASLLTLNSPFAELYKRPYPTLENVVDRWNEFEQKQQSRQQLGWDVSETDTPSLISVSEAKAVINWMYRAYPNVEKRKEATREMVNRIQELYNTGELAFSDSIIYVKSRVDIYFIKSFNDFYQSIQDIDKLGHTVYYRGHSSANYSLLPSVMRKEDWLIHERDMYNEVLIECPSDFEKCSSHLDYLVHMQHYGLPTRLLDITRNPLVALYFACIDNQNMQGEVVVFDVENSRIKYPGSDTVSILASLPLFSHDMKQSLFGWASDITISQEGFNDKAVRLLHEVKSEKPAFRDEINKADIVDCFFVLSEKKNNRIIKQDGAFVICGLLDKNKNPINRYRYRQKKKAQIFIIPAKAKKQIVKQLEKFSINKASLFPEIADVTDFIKSKY